MPFDYKKEYKAFYLPPKTPGLITVPAARFLAVRGEGDPNAPEGDYQAAVGMLYAMAYTVKMSRRAGREMEGFFDYVVPPLEGLWRQEGVTDVDYAHKERFRWIAMIRLPEFVTEEAFLWAKEEAERKKKMDLSPVEYFAYDEGECVQCMHLGPYDTEPATVAAMEAYARKMGYVPDVSDRRLHHEIYLSDPRRCAPEKCKTVIRHPVRKA
ncbi:MAG: GyrI-like domain-containing protein [Clostridia bacterium]|nr:GyrI-like domain-containing protein [Clostridia bacterium]